MQSYLIKYFIIIIFLIQKCNKKILYEFPTTTKTTKIRIIRLFSQRQSFNSTSKIASIGKFLDEVQIHFKMTSESEVKIFCKLIVQRII